MAFCEKDEVDGRLPAARFHRWVVKRPDAAGACGGTPPGYKRGYRMFRSNALTCAKQGKGANAILVRSYTPRATRKAFVVIPR